MRDRGVLRVAGLYIALSWLSLQIADVVFPAFDIPDSALRYVLYVAAIGFPIACVLSWFYEITPQGIVSEQEMRDAGYVRQDNRGLTLATLVVLFLALTVSLFVNFKLATDEPEATPDMVSILVADFENLTGDPLFDGSLEPALAIGMEGGPFVSAYARHDAMRVAEDINAGEVLNEESARLVSMREGIDLVLTGSITPVGEGYELSQRVLDPVAGDLVAEAEASAGNKAEVLPAVGELAAQIREALGDVSLEDGNLAANETLTAASLQAVRYYTQAQTHALREENAEAVGYFEKAIAEDPEFGRAYTGWALSEAKLGRRERAEELWEKALSLIGSTSERERYRTLGLYYTTVTGNQNKAIENYQLLVEKYPADGIGWNNLGVAYFYTLQFDRAREVGRELVSLFPDTPAFRANYALFAMYAGDFSVSREEATKVLEAEPGYFLAYLPLAIASINDGDLEAARAIYSEMGEQGERARSMSITGLADIAMLEGDFQGAAELLREGREADVAAGNTMGASYKGVQLARALSAMGQASEASRLLAESLAGSSAISQLVPAALVYVELEQWAEAEAIRQQLADSLQEGRRAGAKFLEGSRALHQGEYVAAVDALNASLEYADSWLTRFYLGKTYFAAGYYAEALGEFELCRERIGESTALYLDDIPTFQHHGMLYYWLGRTRQAMGMSQAALEDFNHYLELRIAQDVSQITLDARQQRQALSP